MTSACTKIEEGTTAFADFGAQPKADGTQREEVYGSREAAGLVAVEGAAVGHVVSPALVLTPELKAKLESACTATLSSRLRASAA